MQASGKCLSASTKLKVCTGMRTTRSHQLAVKYSIVCAVVFWSNGTNCARPALPAARIGSIHFPPTSGAGCGELRFAPFQATPCCGAQFVGKARQLFGGDSAGDDAPEQPDDNARLDTALAASGGSRRALAAVLDAEAPEGPRKRKKKKRRDARDGRDDRSEDGQTAERAQQARLRALLDSGDVPPLAELQVHPRASVRMHASKQPDAQLPARFREARRCPSCIERPWWFISNGGSGVLICASTMPCAVDRQQHAPAHGRHAWTARRAQALLADLTSSGARLAPDDLRALQQLVAEARQAPATAGPLPRKVGRGAEHDRDAELERTSQRKADRRADPREPEQEAAPQKGRRRPEPAEEPEPQQAAHGRAARREVPEQESPRKARRQPDLGEDPKPQRGRHGRDARLEAPQDEAPRKGRRRPDPDGAAEPERAHGSAVQHAEPDADAGAELPGKGRRRAEPDDAAQLDRGSVRGPGRRAEREDPPDEEPPVHRKAHRRAERGETGEAARAIRHMAARDDAPSVAEMQARAPWRTLLRCCRVQTRSMRWTEG